MKTTHVSFVFAAFSVAVAMLSASSAYPTADQEHSPYVIDKLEERFAAMAKDKDSNGRPRLTPIVRIPQEADEDFRWAVKQVLDAGAYGIVLPHLETKADAIRFVQAARVPTPALYQATRAAWAARLRARAGRQILGTRIARIPHASRPLAPEPRGRDLSHWGPNSIQFSGTGMSAFVGQALTAGQEWPRRDLASFTRTINYAQRSSRNELGFAAPTFGGQQQNAYVSGERPGTWDPMGPWLSRQRLKNASFKSFLRRTAS